VLFGLIAVGIKQSGHILTEKSSAKCDRDAQEDKDQSPRLRSLSPTWVLPVASAAIHCPAGHYPARAARLTTLEQTVRRSGFMFTKRINKAFLGILLKGNVS